MERRTEGAGGGKTLRGVVGYLPEDLVLVGIASGGSAVCTRDMAAIVCEKM